MTVHFIGAGPGAPDLITLRGRDLLARCPVCLRRLASCRQRCWRHCPPDARKMDTAPMTLDEIEHEYRAAHAQGQDVARLHSGDLSVYSAVAEQIRRLERPNPVHIDPGGAGLRRRRGGAGARTDRAGGGAERGADPRCPAAPRRCRRARRWRRSARPARHWRCTLPSIRWTHGGRTDAACTARTVRWRSWCVRVGRTSASLRGDAGTMIAAVAGAPIERTAHGVGRTARSAAEDFRDSALYDPDYRRRFARSAMNGANGARPTNVPVRSNTTISTRCRRPQRRARRRSRRAAATASPSADAPAMPKASATVLAPRCGACIGGAVRARHCGQRRQVGLAAFGVQVEPALCQLGHLGDAAGDGDARHRMARADISACRRRSRPSRSARRPAGRAAPATAASDVLPVAAGDVLDAHRARDVDAAMDAVDPRRAGVRHHDRRWCPGSTVRRRCPAGGSACVAANASPPGMEISTTTSPAAPCEPRPRRCAVAIICRGTGLIAGSPGGRGKPGRVTVPTPGPARNTTPVPGAACVTVARTRAPCVTSGSSPASLTTPARALSASARQSRPGRTPRARRAAG